MNAPYDRRQLLALVFVFSLAPIIRLVPGRCTELAEAASWLSPLIAVPFVILFIMYMSAFLRHRRENEGLGEMIVRAVGQTPGRAVLLFSGLYFAAYSGFILRSGADRFVSTVYPASSPWPFVFVMLFIGLVAALGSVRALVRSAKIFAPILAIVLVLSCAFGLSSVERINFLPTKEILLSDLSYSALPVFDVFAAALSYTAFIEGPCPRKPGRTRDYLPRILLISLLIMALNAAIVGNYGAALTLKLSHPFFTMVRDITVFRTVERLEAFVVALWVLPDFVVTSLMLLISSRALQLAFGFKPMEAERMRDMKNGRWLIPVCAVIAAAVACVLPTDEVKMALFSEKIVPAANLLLTAGVYPLCFVIGKLRKKV